MLATQSVFSWVFLKLHWLMKSKSLATMAVVQRTWGLGTDRHGLQSGFSYLFTVWRWASFLTLRVQVSCLWHTQVPRTAGTSYGSTHQRYCPSFRNISCVCICTYVHLCCMRCYMGNGRSLIAFALKELKMLLVRQSTSTEIMGETWCLAYLSPPREQLLRFGNSDRIFRYCFPLYYFSVADFGLY